MQNTAPATSAADAQELRVRSRQGRDGHGRCRSPPLPLHRVASDGWHERERGMVFPIRHTRAKLMSPVKAGAKNGGAKR